MSKGFTLVETLIYIAIIGGILATFIGFSLNISGARNKTYVTEEVQANARIAMDVISQKIQSANGVTTSSSVFNTDPGTLVLTMSSSTFNPTIINLSADDGVLQIKQGTGATTTVTANTVRVTNLQFTNLSASSTHENIKVNLTVEFATTTDIDFQYTQSLTSTISARE